MLAQLAVSQTGWSWDAHLAALRAPEGIALPKTSPRWELGMEKVSFPAIRVPPGCSGTEKLDYCRSASLLSTTFTRLSKTPCHCRYFSHDVPRKKATPVQRAGMYSSSKRKNRYSPFHNNLRRLLNLPVLQLHISGWVGGCLTQMQTTQMLPIFFAWAANREKWGEGLYFIFIWKWPFSQ